MRTSMATHRPPIRRRILASLTAAGMVMAGVALPGASPAWALEPDTTAPTVTITSPVDGAQVTLNTPLTAQFSCADEDGGSGIATCEGDVADGALLDTSELGAKTLTVSATDNATNPATTSVTYTVVAPEAPEAAEVTGTVTDSAGSPQPGSRIEVRATGTTTLAASTTADSDGTYALTVPAGTYDFRVAGPAGSGLGARLDGVTLPAGATTRDWTITTGLVSVSGRVLVGGAPKASASVALYCGAIQRQCPDRRSGPVHRLGAAQRVLLDEHQLLPDRTELLRQRHRHHRHHRHTLPDVDVPSHTLTVTVLNADDTPAPGYTVSTSAAPGSPQPMPISGGLTATYSTMGTRPATTDNDGLATLTLLGTGSQGTLAIAKTGTPTINHPYTATGNTTLTVKLTSGVSVSGRVLVGGAPKASASVALYCGGSSANALTDDQGRFTVSVLPSGSCSMSISSYLTGPNFSANVTGITATTDTPCPTLTSPATP